MTKSQRYDIRSVLKERIKELTALYEISLYVQKTEESFGKVMQGIADKIPAAMQFSDSTQVSIELDGMVWTTSGFEKASMLLSSKIVAGKTVRGSINVFYKNHSLGAEAGFLKEEQNFLDAVARQIAFVIERNESEKDKGALQEQLRHADRLATIGQLAAGVAHELNEPLANILGFAQLAGKHPDMPQQSKQDVEKIITAALHAREIVKKLLLFARQLPAWKTQMNLNKIIQDGIYFLELRLNHCKIELIRDLDPALPDFTADPSQIHQALVNLLVNAIQAMPDGGTLTVRTRYIDDCIVLTVQDTGVGMPEEIRNQLFIPFFTTKDIGQGTGLGLSVVHGILTSHGGDINVVSEPGMGSTFTLRFPLRSQT